MHNNHTKIPPVHWKTKEDTLLMEAVDFIMPAVEGSEHVDFVQLNNSTIIKQAFVNQQSPLIVMVSDI